jgi:hypothetical protein
MKSESFVWLLLVLLALVMVISALGANPIVLSMPDLIVLIIGVFLAIITAVLLHIRKKKLEEVKRVFRKDKAYLYLENFVKKYCKISQEYTEEAFNKIKHLLYTKGFHFNTWQLKQIIDGEIVRQNYIKFKKLILYNEPKNKEQFIENFVEIHGENYSEYLDFFNDVLCEYGFHASFSSIEKKILELKSRIEQAKFEEGISPITIFDYPSYYDLDSMSGYDFEGFLKRLFVKMGYQVEQTKLSGDQGADLVITKFGEKTVVQAKRHSNKITNKAIQEAVAAINFYKADKGLVVATREFTKSAIKLAQANDVELIGLGELICLINKFM